GRRYPKLLIEQLEDRTLLANAVNTFAVLDGLLANPTSPTQIPITLVSSDFTMSHKSVELGFHLEAANGNTLNPAAVQIADAQGAAVKPKYAADDVRPGSTDSLVLAALTSGNYFLKISSQGATDGAFHLEVFLAGDADGNRIVNGSDAALIRGLFGS